FRIIKTGELAISHLTRAFHDCLPIIGSVGLYSLTIMMLGRHVKIHSSAQEFSAFAIGLQVFGVALFVPNVLMRTAIPRLIQGGADSSESASLNLQASVGMWVMVVLAIGFYSTSDRL